jgi:hypothetical protein
LNSRIFGKIDEKEVSDIVGTNERTELIANRLE